MPDASTPYSWTQTTDEIVLRIRLPQGVTSKSLQCVTTPATVIVTLRPCSGVSNITLIDEMLSERINASETLWYVEDRVLTIELQKSSSIQWDRVFQSISMESKLCTATKQVTQTSAHSMDIEYTDNKTKSNMPSLIHTVKCCLVELHLNTGRYLFFFEGKFREETNLGFTEQKPQLTLAPDCKNLTIHWDSLQNTPQIESRTMSIMLHYKVDILSAHWSVQPNSSHGVLSLPFIKIPSKADLFNVEIDADNMRERISTRLCRDSLTLLVDEETSEESIQKIDELSDKLWQNVTLKCRKCKHQLMMAGTIQRALSLPSSQWSEMVGGGLVCHPKCCGEGPGEKGSMLQLAQTPLNARPRVCLIGATHYLLHKQSLSVRAISRRTVIASETPNAAQEATTNLLEAACEAACCGFSEDNAATAAAVHCKRCRVPLGVTWGKNNVTLQKFRLEMQIENNSKDKSNERQSSTMTRPLKQEKCNTHTNLLEKYDVDSHVAPRIIDAAKARGSYNFAIISSDTGALVLRLTLINWTTQLCINPNTPQKKIHFTPVVKVRYKKNDVDIFNSNQKEKNIQEKNINEWIIRQNAEKLVFRQDVCRQLLHRLENSTKLLPEDSRTMFKSTIGFLFW